MWKWGAGIIVGIGMLWSGLWYYAQNQVDEAAVNFIFQEHKAGRDWSCDELNRTGFPFSLFRSCSGSKLSSQAGEDLSLAKLQGIWTVFNPNSVLTEATAPLEFHLGTLRGSASWGHAETRFGGVITQNIRFDTAITALSGVIDAPEGSQALQVEQFNLSLTPGTLKDKDNVLPVDLVLTGVKNPMLAQVFGTQDAVSLKLAGSMDHLDRSQAATLQQVLEQWRQKSGQIEITHFELHAGEFNLNATGTLSLDDQHRLAGTLNAEVSGANGVLTSFGLSPKSSMVGKLISGILSGKVENGKFKGAAVPLRFKDGQVLLGSIPLPLKLEPVY